MSQDSKQNNNNMSGIGMGIIQGISGIAQGIINSKTAKRNTDMTNKANLEQSRLKYAKDVEMWNRQNEYNNPANQMMRLKEAGLNPNMVYGSGKAAGNTSGAMPSYQTAKQDFNYQPVVQNLPNMIGQYQDFALKGAQIDNEHERNNILTEEARIRAAEAKWADNWFNWRLKGQKEKTSKAFRERAVETGLTNYKDIDWNQIDVGSTPMSHRYRHQTDAIKAGTNAKIAAASLTGKSEDLMDQRIRTAKKINQYWEVINLAKLGIGLGNMVTGGVAKIAGKAGAKVAKKAGMRGVKMPKYNSPASWDRLPRTTAFD